MSPTTMSYLFSRKARETICVKQRRIFLRVHSATARPESRGAEMARFQALPLGFSPTAQRLGCVHGRKC